MFLYFPNAFDISSLIWFTHSNVSQAKDALNHKYFSSSPYPKEPDMMPTFPSRHDTTETSTSSTVLGEEDEYEREHTVSRQKVKKYNNNNNKTNPNQSITNVSSSEINKEGSIKVNNDDTQSVTINNNDNYDPKREFFSSNKLSDITYCDNNLSSSSSNLRVKQNAVRNDDDIILDSATSKRIRSET